MRNVFAFAGTALLLALGVTNPGAPATAGQVALAPPSLGVCSMALPQVAARIYDVGARVRVLLFWTGRHEEGRARIAWSSSPDGTRRTELLIGTESRSRLPASESLGLHLRDDVRRRRGDRRLDDGRGRSVHRRGPGPAWTRPHVGASTYRAIRTRIANHAATADLLRLATSEPFTYRDAPALFARLPIAGAPRHLSVPADADPGLLSATSHLIALAVAEAAHSSRSLSHARQRYVYAATTYELALESSAIRRELAIGDRLYGPVLDAAFTILNLSTGETTPFALTVGTAGNLAGVPLRIVYRPRWWLELEITLAG